MYYHDHHGRDQGAKLHGRGFQNGKFERDLRGFKVLEVQLQFSDFILVSSSCSLFDGALHGRRCFGNPKLPRTAPNCQIEEYAWPLESKRCDKKLILAN